MLQRVAKSAEVPLKSLAGGRMYLLMASDVNAICQALTITTSYLTASERHTNSSIIKPSAY
jgi:hypothetical protein